ncbi:MAG: helix-turn-helix domain-containing protein [Acidimicrobiaceae bacterium]|nr:helix-turn-helix domain-containing protein [Acidimicrobiaceae bacterium]MCY3607474.1 helix-turn-helix domain-containing protein [Acidimicrobiaceae bacterium]
MTPLGRELRSLARQIADHASQAGDIEYQQSLRQELEHKLASAGTTVREIAKAAGVSRITVWVWLRQAYKGRYPTL